MCVCADVVFVLVSGLHFKCKWRRVELQYDSQAVLDPTGWQLTLASGCRAAINMSQPEPPGLILLFFCLTPGISIYFSPSLVRHLYLFTAFSHCCHMQPTDDWIATASSCVGRQQVLGTERTGLWSTTRCADALDSLLQNYKPHVPKSRK